MIDRYIITHHNTKHTHSTKGYFPSSTVLLLEYLYHLLSPLLYTCFWLGDCCPFYLLSFFASTSHHLLHVLTFQQILVFPGDDLGCNSFSFSLLFLFNLDLMHTSLLKNLTLFQLIPNISNTFLTKLNLLNTLASINLKIRIITWHTLLTPDKRILCNKFIKFSI